MDTGEALKRLSDLRLGVDMGILEDIDITDINQMMLLIQPGNLQKTTGRILSSDERDTCRAQLVREMMNKQKNH
jgi:protein arginine kinase